MPAYVDGALPVADTRLSFSRFLDRWIWALLAAFFVALALAGFIPSSLKKIQAIQTGEQPPLPWFLHLHALAMGSWFFLLLAQTMLIGTKHRRLHISLGATSLVVAPMVVIMMAVMASGIWMQIRGAPAETPLAAIGEATAFVLLVQGRAIVLFATFFVWAYRSRLTAPDTHKRMMLLATWSLIDAAIARIPGALELGRAIGIEAIGLTSNDDIPHFWMLVVLLPALLYEIARYRRIHYAWYTGIAMFLAFAVAAHYLEAAPLWWQQVSGAMIART